jgi:hypothetical protein
LKVIIRIEGERRKEKVSIQIHSWEGLGWVDKERYNSTKGQRLNGRINIVKNK